MHCITPGTEEKGIVETPREASPHSISSKCWRYSERFTSTSRVTGPRQLLFTVYVPTSGQEFKIFVSKDDVEASFESELAASLTGSSTMNAGGWEMHVPHTTVFSLTFSYLCSITHPK